MDNLQLIPISLSNINFLDKTEYKNLSTENRKALVNDSNRRQCKGEYFCFYLIKDNLKRVGVINMCGHGREVVSVAPEILEEYRSKGYAKRSLLLAYSIAKELGFKKVTAGIREDNVVSQKLHEKLGFEFVGTTISKRGNLLKNYVMNL